LDQVISRAIRRFGRVTTRAHQRAAALPVRLRHRGLAIPPGRLIHLVAGSEDVRWFLDSGAVAAASLRELLARNGVRLGGVGSLLDFGCGVGRVIRHWDQLHGVTIHGTDYNPDLVAWCREHLAFARFGRNTLDGRIDLSDGSIGFAYALSVFTHLPEPDHRHALSELRRVVRPGGHLAFTTHGDCYRPILSGDEQARFDAGQLVVKGGRRAGSNDCATFHPPTYVRAAMLEGFDLIDHQPEGARGNPRQDYWLVRRR
jgi:SAM-dependent methyltransferase